MNMRLRRVWAISCCQHTWCEEAGLEWQYRRNQDTEYLQKIPLAGLRATLGVKDRSPPMAEMEGLQLAEPLCHGLKRHQISPSTAMKLDSHCRL